MSGEIRKGSGERARFERSVGIRGFSNGLCDLSPVMIGPVPVPFRELKEDARWTVTIDDDEAELGLEFCRWCKGGLTRVDAISIPADSCFMGHAMRVGCLDGSLPVARIIPNACIQVGVRM